MNYTMTKPCDKCPFRNDIKLMMITFTTILDWIMGLRRPARFPIAFAFVWSLTVAGMFLLLGPLVLCGVLEWSKVLYSAIGSGITCALVNAAIITIIK